VRRDERYAREAPPGGRDPRVIKTDSIALDMDVTALPKTT
jgi:hypothetical protein